MLEKGPIKETYIYMHTHTYTQTHTRTHTLSHAHTHTNMLQAILTNWQIKKEHRDDGENTERVLQKRPSNWGKRDLLKRPTKETCINGKRLTK